MKKSVLILFVFILSQNLFAQTIGEQTWERKYGFEEGLTQALVFDADYTLLNGNSQVLLAFNSYKGTINTYKINKETGAISGILFKTTLPRKGVWGVSLINDGISNHLAISYADYGAFEIYDLNKNGSVGDKTYETETFEKGISMVIALPKSILLVKPNAGFAWLIDHKFGKLGDITWQTQNWEKGMTSGICYHASSAMAAITHPDGKFWLVDCKSKEAKIAYSTNEFAKGITTIASNPSMRNFIMLSDPSTGHQWGIKGALNGVEVLTDSPNWEKGLNVQAFAIFQNSFGLDAPTDGFLYVFKPEIGAVWVFKVNRK